MKYSILLVILSLLTISCSKQEEKDRELILKYISDNSLNAVEGPEGLFYVIETEGSGANPITSSTVTVHYEGFLLNGDKFDSSIDRGQPATFPLTAVIRGWQLGIPRLKEGGKGKLLIPSSLGYGRSGSGNSIPANAVLIFNVELLNVQL
jgi:FKBP-type peptidyl-prolyl cis-trans isomerase FkpA